MNLKSSLKKVTPGLAVGGGVIASGYASRFIPVANEKLKAAIVCLGGLLVASSKNKMAESFGLGLFGGGVQQLAKGFGIGGDDTMIAAPSVMISDVEDYAPVSGPADADADAPY